MSGMTGQTLRRAGLALEALSMLAMLSVRRGHLRFWEATGLDPFTSLLGLFGVGVICWAAGTWSIRRARQSEAAG